MHMVVAGEEFVAICAYLRLPCYWSFTHGRTRVGPRLFVEVGGSTS